MGRFIDFCFMSDVVRGFDRYLEKKYVNSIGSV